MTPIPTTHFATYSRFHTTKLPIVLQRSNVMAENCDHSALNCWKLQ